MREAFEAGFAEALEKCAGCATPGLRLRSGGSGRGLARGGGAGPIGRMAGEGLESTAECKTPGRKIRSKGKGRGLARGKGKGPLGIPAEGLEKTTSLPLLIRVAQHRKFQQANRRRKDRKRAR